MRRDVINRAACVAFALLLLGLFPKHALAWGQKGHQIVAGIAERFLSAHSPQTLARAKQLLGGQSLVSVATFANDVRNERPYTKNWHFVDIPLKENGYVAGRDSTLKNRHPDDSRYAGL